MFKEAAAPAHSAAAHTWMSAGLTKPASSGPSDLSMSTGSKIHTWAPRMVEQICIRPLDAAPKKRLLPNGGSLTVT